MNFKNLLKEQLLSEIIRPLRDFDPNLLSPKMKLKMGSRKGPDGNIISKLFNRKLQPTKWEQEMRDRPRLTSTELENYVERQRQQQRERRSRLLRGEYFQSDLGTQPQKPYKKKFGISLGFRKQNLDRTIY
jgi:hypothetical protein